jgi:hypothetical protein
MNTNFPFNYTEIRVFYDCQNALKISNSAKHGSVTPIIPALKKE